MHETHIVISWPGNPERGYIQRLRPRTATESPLSNEEELILALHAEVQRLHSANAAAPSAGSANGASCAATAPNVSKPAPCAIILA